MFNKSKDKKVGITEEEKKLAEELNEAIEKKLEEVEDKADKEPREYNAAPIDKSDEAAVKLERLTQIISREIAERAAIHFADVTQIAGVRNMGRVLSLMEECEPYVNVLILESVFATYGITAGVEDMEFLYFCVENAPQLFEYFKEDFMTMEEIDEIVVELITSIEDLVEYPGFINRRNNEWPKQ